ncbi:pectinesterase family protein [Pedobacter xixiisoli]|uniref:Por secretion system C-terminal sorting domain-containing protein n=1 Tax=Pedobacter xixiisoli TaxID=1476464 RepID=A0A286ADY5_9SPHI|nr:pectinesterase family protein [Pedobacter xixiisoli]SOD20103.1 Por secretion system C-terminal sorting domain-containing protein [Pedobacter xixiisoli]
MNKNFTLFICALLFFVQQSWAQEKLLYSTEFNAASSNAQSNWAAVAATSSEQTVTKTTDFSAESLTFKFFQIAVSPTAVDAARFKYAPAAADAGGVQVTAGWAQAQKNLGSYIELSALNSITKVVFTHGATGGSRGYKLWKKVGSGAWTEVSTSFAVPSSGQQVTVNINETNVALKFTNLNDPQNAYLFDLKIYGNYTSTVTQYPLTTTLSNAAAGTIARSPNATDYDAGTDVSLTATSNFGYRFVKWVDAANGDADLSTANPYTVTMNASKSVKAVYEAKNTYTFTVTKEGSTWGEVKLTPEPTNGKYEEGTEVTMDIISNPVTTFSRWEDNTTAAQRTILVNGNKAFTATFDEIPFIVGWNFKDQNIKTAKIGDYYAESSNTGTISVFEPSGTAVNWLSNAGTFSPSYPNIRFWTAGADFATKRRYLQAQISTTGYKNIQVRSLVSANYQAYKVMTLQYSTDGTSFTEAGRVDITEVYNSAWKDFSVTLPVGAENQTRIYLRWVADATSGLLGTSTDNDGSAFTNIYVYADKEVVNDTAAPLLVSTTPANASSTATINGSVVLTFNERVKLGTGSITLGSKTLAGTFGSKTVTFPYEKLSYNTSYTVTVPNGALTDMSGNAYAGTSFTFTTANRAEPTKKLYDAIVAKDGSGNYTSVIDAIAAAPASRTIPWIIFVKNGTYTGHHDIPANKPFIHLIGQNRNGVIITDNRLSGDDEKGTMVYHVSLGATMVVNSPNVYFENITFENSIGYNDLTGPQALALYTIADKFAMNNCYLRSYQDTYLTSYNSLSARHYVRKSKIEGAVDFVYGAGDVFFESDTLAINRSTGGYIVAPSHQSGTAYGYVFSNNVITRANKVSNTGTNPATNVDGNSINVTTYLGRPWQNAAKTVFINTKLAANLSVYPEGWAAWNNAPAIFADYGTVNSNGQAVDISQRRSSYPVGGNNIAAQSSLTDNEAANYTYENVILRSGDSWDPRLIAEAPEQPGNLSVNSSFKLTWDAVSYTRLYVITRNNAVIGFSLTNEYTDATATAGTNYIYKVQAASEYGALSTAAELNQVLPITGLTFNAKKVGNTAALNWSTLSEKNTSHFDIERSSDGKAFERIGKRDAVGESSSLKSYQFADVNPLSGYNYYRVKAVDKDGQFSESTVLSLKFDLQSTAFNIYPNPTANHEFSIDLLLAKADEVTVKIISLDGRVLQTETGNWLQGKSAKKITLNSNIPSGIYLVNISGNGLNEVSKIVVK